MKFLKKHKKFLLLIVIFSSVLIIYKNNNKNDICYTSLGDGFAKGIDSYGQEDYGYSDYLKDYLKEANRLNVYSKDFTDKEYMINTLYADIIMDKKGKTNIKQTLRESKIVTLSIGLNDLLYKLSVTENINQYKLEKIISDIDKSLDVLLEEINKYYKGKIYIIAYYYKKTDNYYLTEGVKKLNELYKNKKNIIYISSEKVENNYQKYFLNPSSLYPNREGYMEIYKEIALKISKKLEK